MKYSCIYMFNILHKKCNRNWNIYWLIDWLIARIVHSLEMLFNISLRIVKQLDAAMQIGKFAYAQTIAGIQLGLQEITAGIPHIRQLQQIGRRQQHLDIVLVHLHIRCVHVIDEQLQSTGIDTLQRDARFARFLKTGEHCIKVGAAGGQDHAMRWNFHIVRDQNDITKLFLSVPNENGASGWYVVIE